MSYLKTYLEKIKSKGNLELAISISKTSEEIGMKYLQRFSFISHEVGLLFGNVQSGKTGQMLGVICKATDLGFPIFLLLTTDNIVLQQQTLDRVKEDLEGYCICGENDSTLFVENALIRPTIIVLKKNSRILKLWANVLNSTGFMRGNPLFVIDDEADAASLNTLVNNNQQSSINKYLSTIRRSASSSLFLQVTGTPQAIYLQTSASDWRPLFTHYFQPGNAYLGGEFFFPEVDKPKCIRFIDDLVNPVRDLVVRHLLVSAQIFSTEGKVSNCLIHPSVRQSVHEKFERRVHSELKWCQENLNGQFNLELKDKYAHLSPSKFAKTDFNKLVEIVSAILTNNEFRVLVMNGKNSINSLEYAKGCNFIIGGNTLGRGVTFPSLQTIFYTRTSKKPQADTMWQHSRMFGYDRDAGMMLVYIDQKLYKIFSNINSTNNAIIAQVEKGYQNIKIYYSPEINPTRKNVLDNNCVIAIAGGTNYFPYSLKNNTTEAISQILAPFSSNEPFYQVSIRMMRDLLSHLITGPDFKLSSFDSILSTILAESPTSQGILIVRRNRDITQGTGALLSPNDWKISNSFQNKVVLTMYQVTGQKGWGGEPLWVPNIKLPKDCIYYDVIEN